MTQNNKKYAIYARSVVEQDTREEQISDCIQYIQNQYEISVNELNVFSDIGSGLNLSELSAYNQLLQSIEIGLINIIVVKDFYYLPRKLGDFFKALEWFKIRNVTLIDCKNDIEVTPSSNDLYVSLVKCFDEHYRQSVTYQVREGLKNRMSFQIKV